MRHSSLFAFSLPPISSLSHGRIDSSRKMRSTLLECASYWIFLKLRNSDSSEGTVPMRHGNPLYKDAVGAVQIIGFFFAYNVSVWQLPQSRVCDFTVQCKGCGENIPAPVMTMPDTWIIAECPLCGERRSYLPPEIFRGRLSHFLLSGNPAKSEARFR